MPKPLKKAPETPAPAQIRAARDQSGLTQTEAGAVVHAALRTWQQWEAGERAMHPGFWELWHLKVFGRAPPD